jgi:hypothetical protein
MLLVLLFVVSLQKGWALPQVSHLLVLLSYHIVRQTLYIPVTKKDLNPRHLGHLLINDTYKVAFCPIEKVMSTQFRQVILFSFFLLISSCQSFSCLTVLEAILCGLNIPITK